MNSNGNGGGGSEGAAPLALLYHENSKINSANAAYLGESLAEFRDDCTEQLGSTSAQKTYATSQRFDLWGLRRCPRPSLALDQALKRRRSSRKFGTRPISQEVLAALLVNSFGVTGKLQTSSDQEVPQALRAAPSGGALYPIETYLAARTVNPLEAGVYHFQPLDCALELVGRGLNVPCWDAQIWPEPGLAEAACLIIFTACGRRTFAKYGERGYRLMLLEAGHMAQNALLVAAALGLNACPLAGFHDDLLARSLQLDPREEPPLYLLAVGWPA